MEPLLLGVSWKHGSAAPSNPLALDRSACSEALQVLRPAVAEAVLVSTCNRTELVLAGPVAPTRALSLWHEAVGAGAGAGAGIGTGRLRPAPCLDTKQGVEPYVHRGAAAVEHLVRVACGLESAIIGDGEVLGQLRNAHQLAHDAGTLGPQLRRVFRHVFATGRTARATTGIAAGSSGIGSAVAAQVAARRRGGPVVIVGAGGAAQSIAGRLRDRGFGPFTIVNRSLAPAELLCDRLGPGSRACGMYELRDALRGAATIVVAVGAHRPVVTAGELAEAPGALVIDVGVPPGSEPAEVVEWISYTDVVACRDEVAAQRRHAALDVERLVRESIDRWTAMWQSRRTTCEPWSSTTPGRCAPSCASS